MFPVSDIIPSRTVPVVTIALIVLNALVFLYQASLLPVDRLEFMGTYALVPAYFSWFSVLSSMFLHAGWLHLIGNMLYLWIFGDNVEDRLGHGRFLLFYLGGGTVAALVQMSFDPFSATPMVGASGAIAAVMGAYFVLYPHSRVLTAVFLLFFFDLVEIPAVFLLGFWFLLQLFNGVGSIAGAPSSAGGVAFWAHVSGFVTGLAVGLVLRVRDSRWR